MSATVSTEAFDLDRDPTDADLERAKVALRAFYRAGRELSEIGFDLADLRGSAEVASSLLAILKSEAGPVHGVMFDALDIAEGLLGADSGSTRYRTGCLLRRLWEDQWKLTAAMVAAGGYLDPAIVSTVTPADVTPALNQAAVGAA